MPRVRKNELLHFYCCLRGAEIIEEDARNFVGEAFDELERLGGAKLRDSLRDVVVVDGMGDVVGLRGR